MPSLDYEMFTENNERGWTVSWHSHLDDNTMEPLDDVLEQYVIDETRIFFSTSTPKNITRKWTARLRGQLKPRLSDVDFEFGLSIAGRAKVNRHRTCPCSDLRTNDLVQ